jgi:type I restriction enzyme S subunit
MREDWKNCKLGDLLKLKNGYAFKSSKYSKDGIPVLRIGDIKEWKVGSSEAKRIEENEEYDNYVVQNGDILIAMSGATTGKFGVYKSEEKAYQNQRVGNLIPHTLKHINKDYVFYLLYSLKGDIEKDAYGGAQPNISATKIENLNTTLAPLPIQRAIVTKIENLFASLDKGIADLKKAQEQLKVYRQAVLKKAFEGDYEIQSFKDCCEKIQDGSHFSPKKQSQEKEKGLYPYITSKNIRNNYMDLSTVTYVDKEFHESIYKRCDPKLGDVLLTKDGVNTGNVTLNTLDEPCSLLSSVCLIRPKKELLLSSFVKYYIQSPEGFKEITGKMTGTAIKRIILKRIKDAPIPTPSISYQNQIIKEIESRLSICDKIEQTITEGLQKSEALRQSILKKAFEGKLLSEAEIEKCKQEADYEPASVLLEKIKKEKKK